MSLSLKAFSIVIHDTILTFGINDGRSITATILGILQATAIAEKEKLR